MKNADLCYRGRNFWILQEKACRSSPTTRRTPSHLVFDDWRGRSVGWDPFSGQDPGFPNRMWEDIQCHLSADVVLYKTVSFYIDRYITTRPVLLSFLDLSFQRRLWFFSALSGHSCCHKWLISRIVCLSARFLERGASERGRSELYSFFWGAHWPVGPTLLLEIKNISKSEISQYGTCYS